MKSRMVEFEELVATLVKNQAKTTEILGKHRACLRLLSKRLEILTAVVEKRFLRRRSLISRN